jgi:sensor domain CHASE-containing protein
MKIKEGFVLKSVAGEHIVVPVGNKAIDFNGLITLNKSGKLLFESLKEEKTLEDLVNILLTHYEIDELTASNDVVSFVDILKSKDII